MPYPGRSPRAESSSGGGLAEVVNLLTLGSSMAMGWLRESLEEEAEEASGISVSKNKKEGRVC